MDNQEAKFRLRAYRAGGADASDPAFAEALEQARRDPELAKWLESEQAFDCVVTKKIQAVAPPAGLRQSILAGVRVSRSPHVVWRRRLWIGLAASVVLLLGVGLGWVRIQARRDVERVSNWALNDLLHGQHGSHGEASARLQAALSEPSLRLPAATLPVDLEQLSTTGCRTLTFAGRQVMEVCFVRAGKEYHLYVMAGRRELPRSPQIIAQSGASAAAWSDDRFTYVIATADAPSALQNVL